MGYFTATSKWGFPHKMDSIIKLYEQGLVSLEDTMCEIGKNYYSKVNINYTYDESGNKIPVTCIDFGSPVVARYVFKEV